jgi:RNA polymerase sigma-70 factor (ECF subfamily)
VPTGEPFEDFYAREQPRLLRLLAPAGVDAADALQEAFDRAARSWDRLAHYDDPAAWVRLVAVRRILNERRGARRRARAVENLARSIAPPRGRDHDELIDLAVAIEKLPAKHRLALALVYSGGMTSGAAAEVMGVSDSTVRSYLLEARRRLRIALEYPDDER